MSAPSSRPPVPRPTVRTTAPPPAPVALIRDRLPTLELADDDLVVEEAPVMARRSTPPPPPPTRSTVVPKLEGVVVPKLAPMPLPNLAALAPSLVAAAPESSVQLRPRPPSMLDPSEALFEGMYELNYADSLWQAARLCASALGRALGARSVIVHAHDLATHELRAVGVHGDGEFDVLGSSNGSEDDLIASAVICNQKAVTMRFDGELPRLAPRRLAMIGPPRTLVAVPAMAWGRCVAVIEIIDPDERLANRVADSAAYVAQRLAEFMSEAAAA